MEENLLKAVHGTQYTVRSTRNNNSLDRELCTATSNECGLVVLVTGGFHSSGIDKQLVGAGFTVLSFVPKIFRVDTENGLPAGASAKAGSAYLSVFAQEKTPLDKLFEGEKLFLSPPVAGGISGGAVLGATLECGTAEQTLHALDPRTHAHATDASTSANPHSIHLMDADGSERISVAEKDGEIADVRITEEKFQKLQTLLKTFADQMREAREHARRESRDALLGTLKTIDALVDDVYALWGRPPRPPHPSWGTLPHFFANNMGAAGIDSWLRMLESGTPEQMAFVAATLKDQHFSEFIERFLPVISFVGGILRSPAPHQTVPARVLHSRRPKEDARKKPGTHPGTLGIPSMDDQLEFLKNENVEVVFVEPGDPAFAFLLKEDSRKQKEYVRRVFGDKKLSTSEKKAWYKKLDSKGGLIDSDYAHKLTAANLFEKFSLPPATERFIIVLDDHEKQQSLFEEVIHVLEGNLRFDRWSPLSGPEQVNDLLQLVFYPKHQLSRFRSDYTSWNDAEKAALHKHYVEDTGFNPNTQLTQIIQKILDDITNESTIHIQGTQKSRTVFDVLMSNILKIYLGHQFESDLMLEEVEQNLIGFLKELDKKGKFRNHEILFPHWKFGADSQHNRRAGRPSSYAYLKDVLNLPADRQPTAKMKAKGLAWAGFEGVRIVGGALLSGFVFGKAFGFLFSTLIVGVFFGLFIVFAFLVWDARRHVLMEQQIAKKRGSNDRIDSTKPAGKRHRPRSFA